jgi:hypothetical protein
MFTSADLDIEIVSASTTIKIQALGIPYFMEGFGVYHDVKIVSEHLPKRNVRQRAQSRRRVTALLIWRSRRKRAASPGVSSSQ